MTSAFLANTYSLSQGFVSPNIAMIGPGFASPLKSSDWYIKPLCSNVSCILLLDILDQVLTQWLLELPH